VQRALSEYCQNLSTAISELDCRCRMCLGDEKTKATLEKYLVITKANVRLLFAQTVLAFGDNMQHLTLEEKASCKLLLSATKRTLSRQFSQKHLLPQVPEHLSVLGNMVSEMMTELEEHSPIGVRLLYGHEDKDEAIAV